MSAWLCRIFGHRWEREPDTKADVRLPTPQDEQEWIGKAEGVWWYENFKCTRCGARGRWLVASREG